METIYFMLSIRKAFLEKLCSAIPFKSSILDIGTGPGDFIPEISGISKEVVTIDAEEKYNTTYCINLEEEDLPFEENRFDIVLAIDFIEHVGPKERGFELIRQMKTIAIKKVIILTPLTWKTNEKPYKKKSSVYYHSKFVLHKTLWSVDDFIGWNRLYSEIGLKNYFFGEWIK